ncbi:hypothetical protein GE300_04710 [Rhodobacteraceae bacterium 2CG4]|uniref:Uncharacterized protein n=1 Tax=Halovulum marinum TaxID=2662447 RepID=A0A6L5YZ07_9RHOB|nr:hypothetical protein [Halovulum marinum]MSU88924.1 hypothetical protein [Halovulum marinum]
MSRAARIAVAAALSALAAGGVSAQAAATLPPGYPRAVFDWAVHADLAARVARGCRGIGLNSELADARLGVALAQAFSSGTAYLAWAGRPGRAAEEARVRALVAGTVARLGADAGYDIADRDQLCALGRAQIAAGTPAGELLFTGGRR